MHAFPIVLSLALQIYYRSFRRALLCGGVAYRRS